MASVDCCYTVLKCMIQGIAVYPDGERICATPCGGELTDAARNYIRRHKPDMLTAFNRFGARAIIREYLRGMPEYVKREVTAEAEERAAIMAECLPVNDPIPIKITMIAWTYAVQELDLLQRWND